MCVPSSLTVIPPRLILYLICTIVQTVCLNDNIKQPFDVCNILADKIPLLSPTLILYLICTMLKKNLQCLNDSITHFFVIFSKSSFLGMFVESFAFQSDYRNKQQCQYYQFVAVVCGTCLQQQDIVDPGGYFRLIHRQ